MSCACKVVKHINKINEYYGSENRVTIKTNITDKINVFFKKLFLWVLLLPFMPIIVLYVLVNKWFFKKVISIDKLFKIKK